MDIVVFKKELNEAVLKYKEEHPRLSNKAIALKINRTEACLRNILDPSKTAVPQADTILNLMALVSGQRQFGLVIESCSGEIRKFLELSFPLYVGSQERRILDEKIKIDDRDSFLMVWLCGSNLGSTRGQILGLLGESLEYKLDDLICAGALEVGEEGRIRVVSENLFVPPTIMKKYVGELFRFWDIQNLGEDNIMYALSNDVSEDFVKKSVKKLSDTYKEIREESKKPENRGKSKFVTCVYGQVIRSLVVFVFLFMVGFTSVKAGGDGGIEGGGGGSNNKMRMMSVELGDFPIDISDLSQVLSVIPFK